MEKFIEGNVNVSKLHLSKLFDLSDVEVIGDFVCEYNFLTNLEGSPHTVGGNFVCRHSNLPSLKGAPHTVGGNFECSINNLTSLEGAPITVYGNFYCEVKPLTSIKGIPERIGGDFFLLRNLKEKFPEEAIRSLSEINGSIIYY